MDWATEATERLREAGYRAGTARTSVIAFLDAQSCCVGAQEIHGALGAKVGLASVYRVLDTLVELALVQRVDVGDGIVRYEPMRADHHHHLAAWLRHAIEDGVQLTGASDHFVSEALYLRDPDHHGIEIYADRPREVWADDASRIGSWPLDTDDLLAAGNGAAGALPAGTRMGHVHLSVSDVDETIGFYRDQVGFDLIAQLGDQAAFLSAGGYHHHLGANTWESRGAAQAPEGTARLLHYTILAPQSELDRLGPQLVDPSGNRAVLSPLP